MSPPYLSIVIPAFNEASRIKQTLDQVVGYLQQQSYRWEVVVANDGSSDNTAAVVSSMIQDAEWKQGVRLIALPHGGKGWAIQQGMLQARGQYRFMCDADLSMPIEQVARFLPPQREGYDLAIGSREAPGARRIGEPARRKLMAKGFSLLVRCLAVPGVADTQCGFKCFRAEAAEVLFRQQRLQGFAFDVEVIFLARRWGMKVVEVPIDWYYRHQSKVRPMKDASRMTLDLLRLRWSYLRGRYSRSA